MPVQPLQRPLRRLHLPTPAPTRPELDRVVAAAHDRPGGADLDEAVELLCALASGLRMKIAVELVHGPLLVKELVARLGARQPLVNQHLRILRSAGVVRADRGDGGRPYALVDTHLAHVVLDALEHVHVHERH